jgi:hypothetical protein
MCRLRLPSYRTVTVNGRRFKAHTCLTKKVHQPSFTWFDYAMSVLEGAVSHDQQA